VTVSLINRQYHAVVTGVSIGRRGELCVISQPRDFVPPSRWPNAGVIALGSGCMLYPNGRETRIAQADIVFEFSK